MATKILVTGVGGGVGQSIIKGLKLAQQRHNAKYDIIGTDSDPLAAGLYRVDRGYIVPHSSMPEYITKLKEICEEEAVDGIIPGTDPEALEIARNKKELEQKGAKVIVSSAEAVESGYDKWKTFQFLSTNGFLTPKTILSKNVESVLAQLECPIIIKPRWGSASTNLFIALSEEDVEYALSHIKEPIAQEYLYPSNWDKENKKMTYLSRQIDEYSTEIWVSREGKVVGSITNWRKMKKGVPSKAIVDDFPEINDAAENIAKKLKGALGAVNLQCRTTNEGPTFFEMNTRFSGSTAVRCAAGFNGPHTMIKHVVLGKEITEEDLKYEKIVEMRWNNEMYISKEILDKTKKSGHSVSSGKIYDYI